MLQLFKLKQLLNIYTCQFQFCIQIIFIFIIIYYLYLLFGTAVTRSLIFMPTQQTTEFTPQHVLQSPSDFNTEILTHLSKTSLILNLSFLFVIILKKSLNSPSCFIYYDVSC